MWPFETHWIISKIECVYINKLFIIDLINYISIFTCSKWTPSPQGGLTQKLGGSDLSLVNAAMFHSVHKSHHEYTVQAKGTGVVSVSFGGLTWACCVIESHPCSIPSRWARSMAHSPLWPHLAISKWDTWLFGFKKCFLTFFDSSKAPHCPQQSLKAPWLFQLLMIY